MPHNLKILIVEDDDFWSKTINSTLCEVLQADQYSLVVDTAATAPQAIHYVTSVADNPYDLVCLDMLLKDPDGGMAGHGLDVLGKINLYSSAWMVFVLTGVERDDSVKNSLGEDLAAKLQKELRSSVYETTFPRERLMIEEKPLPEETELIKSRLKDVCAVLKQSLSGQNVFKRLKVPNQIYKYEFKDGSWKELNDKQRSMASRKKLLKMSGKKRVQNAQAFNDTLVCRQIRYKCGPLMTEPNSPYYDAVEVALSQPGVKVSGTQIGGDSPVVLLKPHTVLDDNLTIGDGEEWDTTDSDTCEAYTRHIKKIEAELGNLPKVDPRCKILIQEISELKTAIKKLRKRPEVMVPPGSINMRKAKERAIKALRKSGQLELAKHLESALVSSGNSLTYEPPAHIVWNT